MNADWLKEMAPPHAPPPPGWWPLAPGWWLLIGLLLIGALGFFVWWMQPHRRRRRAALRLLQEIESSSLDDTELARRLQDLMRRHALAQHARDSVAQLNGQAWLDFIAAHGGKPLADEAGKALLRASYGSASEGNHRAAWLAGAKAFIRGKV